MALVTVSQDNRGFLITVQGGVQGVGFRPFVFRLAKRLDLKGSVRNAFGGVVIEVEGDKVNEFLDELKTRPPHLSRIEKITVEPRPARHFDDFRIVPSTGETQASPQILPDLATCPDCKTDIVLPQNRRTGYPFTNCTQCGPRFSIILSPPYDRIRTTMRTFTMCRDCSNEYHNPDDRRFHAQPNCCPLCGPSLALKDNQGKPLKVADPLKWASRLLLEGKILALKGIGGFHLSCDATNENAVLELRRRKKRPHKPFALMCGSVEMVNDICFVSQAEERLLTSVEAPILLLMKKKGGIAPAVAPDNGYLGVMLAYAPLHHLLFQQGLPPLVMTSANLKDEPVLATETEVVKKLSSVVDFILTHNRPIVNRSDDSVIFYAKKEVLVRRARGYAPAPIPSPISLKPSLACGTEQKNTFALGRGDKVYLSPHIGDLDSEESLNFFNETLNKYKRWFKIEPTLVACDLHPDYLITRYAEGLRKPLIKVQHHHAHIAATMADNRLKGPVIGIAFDGTGFGTDGKVWGGEFLVADYKRFERKGHLHNLPLVGGEWAIREPMRIAAGYLFYLFGQNIVKRMPELNIYSIVRAQLDSKVNIVETSSMGRLFDAVSALLGLCPKTSFDGQAPIALEAAASLAEPDEKPYPFTVNGFILDPKPIFEGIMRDRESGEKVSNISRRFHRTIIDGTVAVAKKIGEETGINQVCLGGGVFQNRLLLRGIQEALESLSFKVYAPFQVPINDGGVSFGQIMVANAQESIIE